MTANAVARSLFSSYPAYRCNELGPKNCKHGLLAGTVRNLVANGNGLMRMEELGRSLEGRAINLISCGTGKRKVLLWSQMHGDESTATLAMMDMLNFLVHRGSHDRWADEMLATVTLYFLPMLNPDGAERVQRHTAVNIDMNRDARVLATPEAGLLRDTQRRLGPHFGFNLHDQALSTVGNSKAVTAIALLAPALDDRKSIPPVRARAKKVAATIANSLGQFIKGHIATYDDTYEPRAFGDCMQAWGTSTVLIESGHWPGDKEKTFIRKLNYVALLSSLFAIGNTSYQQTKLHHYSKLQVNGKRAYDIIIRDVVLIHPEGWSRTVDIGMMINPPENAAAEEVPTVTVKEIGDLTTHSGLEEIPGRNMHFPSGSISIEKPLPLDNFSPLAQALQA